MIKAFIKELFGAVVFAIMMSGIVYFGVTTSPLYG